MFCIQPTTLFFFFFISISLSSLTSLFSLLSLVVRRGVVQWSGSWVRWLWVLILVCGSWSDGRGWWWRWSDGLRLWSDGHGSWIRRSDGPGFGSYRSWVTDLLVWVFTNLLVEGCESNLVAAGWWVVGLGRSGSGCSRSAWWVCFCEGMLWWVWCCGLNPSWRVAMVGLCVYVLLGGLIGNGGLGCGFALCVFFAWWVCWWQRWWRFLFFFFLFLLWFVVVGGCGCGGSSFFG